MIKKIINELTNVEYYVSLLLYNNIQEDYLKSHDALFSSLILQIQLPYEISTFFNDF
jgi:hypothetical protein